MAALTVYLTSTAATTVSTANKLQSTAPASETSKSSKVAKSTGWGVLQAQGTTGAWAAAASEPAFGDTHGFLLDDTSLEGKHIAAGTWSVSVKLEAGTSGFTGTPHVRIGKRSSAGVFTEIVNIALASTAFSTTSASTLTGSGSGADTVFATGDKLYVQVDMQITVASGNTSATCLLFENGGAAEAITTPGTYTLVTGAANLSASAVETAAGFQTAKTGASLSARATEAGSGFQTAKGVAALSAHATESATGVRTRPGAASLTSTATLSASGTDTPVGPATVTGAASLTAHATLSATGVRTRLGASSLSAGGTLSATGGRTVIGGASPTAHATLTATAADHVFGASSLTATSTLRASHNQPGPVVAAAHHGAGSVVDLASAVFLNDEEIAALATALL